MGAVDVCVVVLLGFLLVGTVTNASFNYITWDDMSVPKTWVLSRDGENYNGSRVLVVDWRGSGDSVTVQGAVDMVPPCNTRRTKIHILPGIYREKVYVQRSKPYVSLIGSNNGTAETTITWNDKASDLDSSGNELGTYRSASVTVESDYFCATGITFQNTVAAVPGTAGVQAVALRIAGDRAMFYKVKFVGSQDTLLDQTGRHYFCKCHIEGSVDFIFGRARSLYQDCVIQSTAESNGAIAAHHRDTPNEESGFSFVNCTISGTGKVLLGRAWGSYSRTIYSYCYIEDIIRPPGWSDWDVPTRQKTADFGEYECSGKGANTTRWVPWAKSFIYEEVKSFLNTDFIEGHKWLRI